LHYCLPANLEGASREETEKKAGSDCWLAETSYKNTAQQAMSSFRVRCEDLKIVLSDVLDVDVMRQNRTKEILVSFLPLRRRLFEDMLPCYDSSRSCLGKDSRFTRGGIQSELDRILQTLSMSSVSESKRSRSSVINRSRGLQKLDLSISPSVEVASLQARNPFGSGHVKEVKAAEVKSGIRSPWRLALTVVSTDNFFHIMLCTLRQKDVQNDEFRQKPELLMASKLQGKTPDLSFSLTKCKPPRLATSEEYIEFTLDERRFSMRLTSPAATAKWYEDHEELWLDGIEGANEF